MQKGLCYGTLLDQTANGFFSAGQGQINDISCWLYSVCKIGSATIKAVCQSDVVLIF